MAGQNGASAGTTVIAGGAGFLGYHLCRLLLARGHHVTCVDSFITGSHPNAGDLARHADFGLVEQDICEPLRFDRPVRQIYNLACAASPPRYQADPVHTMMTSVVGTKNLLDLAEQHGARFVQASTSEVYGDPLEHPQNEDYWGNVNCTGPRACYDEGKRAAESLCFDYLRARRTRCAHLQHLRTAHAAGRRAHRIEPDRPGAERATFDHLRLGRADAVVLLRRRPRPGNEGADGGGGEPPNPHQSRQSG
jgi:UDP-glucose 4-epimerase